MKAVNDFPISNRLKQYLSRKLITYFNTVQCEALLSGLLDGKNLLISSPSGSGKTLIGEVACLRQLFNKGKKVVYLVPLKALANEKYEAFTKELRGEGLKIGISTGDFTIDKKDIEKNDYLIMTYERFDTYLRQKAPWLKDIQVFVMDEIQIINDPRRGPRIESVIARIRAKFPSAQILGLSGTLANASEIASWMNATLIESSYRPVPIAYNIIETPNKQRAIEELLLELAHPILLFVQTRRETESIAKKLARYIERHQLLTPEEELTLQRAFDPARFLLEYRIDPELLELLAKGVAFHHGGLSLRSRQLIEEAIRKHPIKIITCTSTLAAGINTPVRSVIIKDVEIRVPTYETTPQTRTIIPLALSTRELEPNLFHQIIGRAGRPQYSSGHCVGTVLVRNTEEKHQVIQLFFRKVNNHFEPKYNNITSKFNNLEVLKEQILVHVHDNGALTKEEIENVFEQTLWWHELSARYPDASVSEFLELSTVSLNKTIRKFSHPHFFTRAENYSKDEIVDFFFDRTSIKGIFRDPTINTAVIHRDHISCSCADFRIGREGTIFCPHLIRLALEGFRQNATLTSVILTQALNKEFVLNSLMADLFLIRTLDGKYKCTDLGRIVVESYLTPSSATFIIKNLPFLTTEHALIEFMARLYVQESKKITWEDRFVNGISAFLQSTIPNYYQRIKEVSVDVRIGQGDLEEFLNYSVWSLDCISQFANELQQETAKTESNTLLFELKRLIGIPLA
ncbi:MAG: DEAD/DEAH box helicase [Candidatus Helarchaeota archaeon]